MTKQQKLDLLIKIMMVLNNSLLALSFIVAGLVGSEGLICSISMYLYIGLILAGIFRHTQHFVMTLIFWLPAMSFKRVTAWISK